MLPALNPLAWGALALAAFVGAAVQRSIGVGSALIIAPVLGLLAPDLLPVALLLLMVPLNVVVAWGDRAALDRAGAAWITVGRLPGTAGGLAILAALSGAQLRALVGWATLLVAAVTLLAPRFAPGRAAFVTAGVITGVTETATGIGGPPLALVYQHHPAPVVRATLATCFLVGEVVSLALLAGLGRVTGAQVAVAAVLLPPLGLGIVLGAALRGRVDARGVRGALLGFAVLSGVACLL